MSRKLILNMAISLDGYISTKEGTYDWIVGDGDHRSDRGEALDFEKFNDDIEYVLMGRLAFEECDMMYYANKKVIVATSKRLDDYDNITFVNENIVTYIERLKKESKGDIWLFGGGILVDTFLKVDAIDLYIIGIIPILLGSGRKLFVSSYAPLNLRLIESSSSEGVVILKYLKRSLN